MKIHFSYKIVIILLLSLLCSCNNEIKDVSLTDNKADTSILNPDSNEINTDNEIPDIKDNFEDEKPNVTDVSRFAFTYQTEDFNKINVYDKINGNDPIFELDNETNVWINYTKDDRWYQVIIDDKWGFIKKENIKLYPRAKININQGNLNLREGKSTNTKIVDTLPKDEIVFVLNIDDSEWYEIFNKNGKVGYTASKYLKFIDSKDSIIKGIDQEEFLSNYFQLDEDEYLLLMRDYKFVAAKKHLVMGDFNGGGRLDKVFFSMKKGNDSELFIVSWHSESNTYIVIDSISVPSYMGLELFSKGEILSNYNDNNDILLENDGFGLVNFADGSTIIYYWSRTKYESFIYNR